jgi:Rieske 2Fe-2S family protein
VSLAADDTWVECQWLFDPDAVARRDFDPSYAVDFWDITNRQDWAACEGVQRGLKSAGYRPGPFSMTEDAVCEWVQWLARSYLAGEQVRVGT